MKKKIEDLNKLVREYKVLEDKIDEMTILGGSYLNQELRKRSDVEVKIKALADVPLIVYMHDQLVESGRMLKETTLEYMRLHSELGHYTISEEAVVPDPRKGDSKQ